MTEIRGKARVLALVMVMSMLAFGAVAPRAHAQTGTSGTSISPPVTDVTANAGESLVKYLEVSNSGNASQSYTFVVANLSASGENGDSAYTGVESGDLASWITLSPESVTLGPGESIDVKLTVDVPANASGGGHYATVFAKSGTSGSVDGTGSAVSFMVGANVLLKVAGNVVERAQIASFGIADSSFDVGETAAFEVRVTNLGNSHIAPTGYVELFRNGSRVAQLPVNETGGNVLPNSTRRFEVASDALYLPGSYTAKVSLTYGSGSILTTDEDISFVVRGEYSVLILVSVLFAVLVGALALALMVKRKKVKV